MQFELIIDFTYENARAAMQRLGVHHVSPVDGSVHVWAKDAGEEMITYRVVGNLPAILAWLGREFEDHNLALEEYTQAALDGRLTPAA